VAFASTRWAESQVELGSIIGISQAMISGVVSGTKPGGGRILKSLSSATGISMEDILSGVGLHKLRAKTESHPSRVQHENRTRAAEALAKLFDMPFDEIVDIFDELGVALPSEVSATTWFDVGRLAIERRKAGLALTRRITP
jgi:hypothetical protein